MDLLTRPQLIERIEDFLDRHDMAPTRFGRDATGQAQLLKTLRDGRDPSLGTAKRILDFIAERDAERDASKERAA